MFFIQFEKTICNHGSSSAGGESGGVGASGAEGSSGSAGGRIGERVFGVDGLGAAAGAPRGLTASPPAMVARSRSSALVVVLERNFTEPSANSTRFPPG